MNKLYFSPVQKNLNFDEIRIIGTVDNDVDYYSIGYVYGSTLCNSGDPTFRFDTGGQYSDADVGDIWRNCVFTYTYNSSKYIAISKNYKKTIIEYKSLNYDSLTTREEYSVASICIDWENNKLSGVCKITMGEESSANYTNNYLLYLNSTNFLTNAIIPFSLNYGTTENVTCYFRIKMTQDTNNYLLYSLPNVYVRYSTSTHLFKSLQPWYIIRNYY